jgi:hypothetical protein
MGNSPEPAVEEAAFGLDPVPEPMAGGEPVSRAASELKRRVEDLLTEAKAKADAGERNEAYVDSLPPFDPRRGQRRGRDSCDRRLEAASVSELDAIEQSIIEGLVAAMESDRLDDAERCFREVLERAPKHRG